MVPLEKTSNYLKFCQLDYLKFVIYIYNCVEFKIYTPDIFWVFGERRRIISNRFEEKNLNKLETNT